MADFDWVKYKTIQHPGGGSVDVWRGDQIDDPNKPNKQHLSLNSISVFYRLNGAGEWRHRRDFDVDLMAWLQHNPEVTAEEVWISALRKD